MAQNLCRNIEVAHGQVEHDGEVVQVARSGGPIRHNFDGTVQGSPRACLAGRQVAHTGGPCGSCRRRGRTERAHRALENAARFPRASTGLSTSDHPRQTPEEHRVLLGNPDRPQIWTLRERGCPSGDRLNSLYPRASTAVVSSLPARSNHTNWRPSSRKSLTVPGTYTIVPAADRLKFAAPLIWVFTFSGAPVEASSDAPGACVGSRVDGSPGPPQSAGW